MMSVPNRYISFERPAGQLDAPPSFAFAMSSLCLLLLQERRESGHCPRSPLGQKQTIRPAVQRAMSLAVSAIRSNHRPSFVVGPLQLHAYFSRQSDAEMPQSNTGRTRLLAAA